MRKHLSARFSRKKMMDESDGTEPDSSDGGGRRIGGSMRNLFAESGGKRASASMRNLLTTRMSKRNVMDAEIEAAFNDDGIEVAYSKRWSEQPSGDLRRMNASVGNFSVRPNERPTALLKKSQSERPTALLTKLKGQSQSTSALYGSDKNTKPKPRNAIKKHTDELDVFMSKEMPFSTKEEVQTDLKKGKFYRPPASLPEGLELPPEAF